MEGKREDHRVRLSNLVPQKKGIWTDKKGKKSNRFPLTYSLYVGPESRTVLIGK